MIMKKSESTDAGGMLDSIKKIEADDAVQYDAQKQRTKTQRVGSFFRRSSKQIDVPALD